jgi:hypothetical protein
MEHYSLEKWADFARQVTGEQERTEMQSHLENGCRKCSKVLGLWQRVQLAARREHGYQPPDSAVRSMKGTFAIQGPLKATRSARLVAELLFDSTLNPLLAGVRSSGTVPRQLLYGVGNDYRIDVRIDPQAETGKADVAGQVLNSVQPSRVNALRVALLSGRKTVSEAVTNQYGEFQLVADPTGRFHLKLGLPGQEVALPAIEPTPRDFESLAEVTDYKILKKFRRRVQKRTRKKV